jgi:hypothetical protein
MGVSGALKNVQRPLFRETELTFFQGRSKIIQKRAFFESIEIRVRFFRRFILYPYYNWFWKQRKR